MRLTACVISLSCHAWTISFFFFNDTATTEIYTLSLHDALPIYLDLSSLWQLYDIDRPALKDPPFVPSTNPRFPEGEVPKSVFATLRAGDVLVHPPFEPFATSVQRFSQPPAPDPHLPALKQPLSRS